MLAGKLLDLPYRPCVGIMLINRDGLVWIGRRRPKWAGDGMDCIWQMPQGGILSGEAARDAALRELEELLGIALKGRYRGQRQKWFAMRFTGRDAEIDIAPRGGHKAEFDAWRWAAVSELPGLIVSFKRQVYADVVREFAAYVGQG